MLLEYDENRKFIEEVIDILKNLYFRSLFFHL